MTSPASPPPADNTTTRRYLSDQDYTRDAQNMLAHGWQVASITRDPDNTIAATYTYTDPTPAPTTTSAAGMSAEVTPSTSPRTAPPATAATPPLSKTAQSKGDTIPATAQTAASPATVGAPSPVPAPRGAEAHAQLYPGGAKRLLAFWSLYLLTGWFLLLGLGVGPVYMRHYEIAVASVMVVECVALFIWDWHNASTLFGALRWGSMPWWERIIGGIFFAAFPTLYLLMATVYHFRGVGASPRQYAGRLVQNFRVSSGWVKAGAVAATIVLVIFFCSGSTMVMALAPSAPTSATASHVQAHAPLTQAIAPAKTAPTATQMVPTELPTATAIPTATEAPTATAVPATPTPRPQPTATPRPVVVVAPTATPRPPAPTATPKPTCNYGGAPSNPWCYTFNNTGKLIYGAPGGFCTYFQCIGTAPSYTSFWNGKGYVIECNDGKFSQSGGIQGACSYHNGEMRPLYQP